MKQTLVAWPRQPAIEEHWHRSKNDAAIGIVLHLVDGGIADAHWAVAAIALQIGRRALMDHSGRHHTVERAELFVRLGRNRQRERNEFFHRARSANAVERLHDEIGVAQPAIAVIPS